MLAYQPKDSNYIGKSNCNNCKLLFNKCLGALDATNCDLTIEGLQEIENYTTFSNQQMFTNDSLSPARGIINGLLISIPIWVIVGLIVWWVI
jgi:hypothetical protein